MSRYFDKDGKEIVCSRAEYIVEMEKRGSAAVKVAEKPKKAAKKGGN